MNERIPPTNAGGGGLIGIASTLPVSSAPLIEALLRLRARGNGLGGGVALAGCFPRLRQCYALSIALLENQVRRNIERRYITPNFDIYDITLQPERDDHRALPSLNARPPRVVRYFVRARAEILENFAVRNGFHDDIAAAEDELVHQVAQQINTALYDANGKQSAFVLSYGRDMMILKGVGYADAVARFYRLDEGKESAHLWLGQQHYPAQAQLGSVPPFPTLDGALALGGSFANRHTLRQYIRQRGYRPRFRADAELAALLFDFYRRSCRYRLDLVLEALLPTASAGLARLSTERRARYRQLQHTHAPGIPEGAALMVTAQYLATQNAWQMAGAVDANARRPNVFALQEGITGGGLRYGVGMVASEYEAIRTAFVQVAAEQSAVCPSADKVWTARGYGQLGADDGGAYHFTLTLPEDATHPTLTCKDKFGRLVTTDAGRAHQDSVMMNSGEATVPIPFAALADAHLDTTSSGETSDTGDAEGTSASFLNETRIEAMYNALRASMATCSFATLGAWLDAATADAAATPTLRNAAVGLLTRLYDRTRVYDTGAKKRSAVRVRLGAALSALFNAVPTATPTSTDPDRRLTWVSLATRGIPALTRGRLYIDATDLPMKGTNRLAEVLIQAHRAGWRWFVIFGCKGDRFVGAGLGADTSDVWIDIYGTPGDYLAAGLDGAKIHVHGTVQDQTGYLMTRGRLVVHGDVGQALLYGATGGTVYILGSVGARAFAEASGEVHAVVNGVADGALGATPHVLTAHPAPAQGAEEAEWQALNMSILLQQNTALFGLPTQRTPRQI